MSLFRKCSIVTGSRANSLRHDGHGSTNASILKKAWYRFLVRVEGNVGNPKVTACRNFQPGGPQLIISYKVLDEFLPERDQPFEQLLTFHRRQTRAHPEPY